MISDVNLTPERDFQDRQSEWTARRTDACLHTNAGLGGRERSFRHLAPSARSAERCKPEMTYVLRHNKAHGSKGLAELANLAKFEFTKTLQIRELGQLVRTWPTFFDEEFGADAAHEGRRRGGARGEFKMRGEKRATAIDGVTLLGLVTPPTPPNDKSFKRYKTGKTAMCANSAKPKWPMSGERLVAKRAQCRMNRGFDTLVFGSWDAPVKLDAYSIADS